MRISGFKYRVRLDASQWTARLQDGTVQTKGHNQT
jgi:hypothetical protein